MGGRCNRREAVPSESETSSYVIPFCIGLLFGHCRGGVGAFLSGAGWQGEPLIDANAACREP